MLILVNIITCLLYTSNAYGLYNPTTKKGDVIPLDKNGKLAKSKADTVKPVSYTHLDVYKRQTLYLLITYLLNLPVRRLLKQ